MYLKRIYNNVTDAVYLIAESVTKTLQNWRDITKKNRSDLIRGSVLDPLNHPSYSKDKH